MRTSTDEVRHNSQSTRNK